MLNGDPEFEMLCEIDQWRFLKFIMLEIQAQKPVPIDLDYLKRKGFDDKKRPISLTIKMLHNFIECVTQLDESVYPRTRVELEEELDKNDGFVTDFFSYFLLKTRKQFKLTQGVRELIVKRLKDGFTIEQMKQAVDNFVQDDWPDRVKHLDLVYCIGVRNKIDNLEKWLNAHPKQKMGNPL